MFWISPLGCDINRIITDLYNNDPCRISRVYMLENIEKSLDINGRDTINGNSKINYDKDIFINILLTIF